MANFPTIMDDAGDIGDGLQVWSAERRSLCLERDGGRMLILLVDSSELFLGALWNLQKMELAAFWGRGAEILKGAGLGQAENEERIFSEFLAASLPMSQLIDSRLGDFDLEAATRGVEEDGGGLGPEDAAHAKALFEALRAGRSMDLQNRSAITPRSGGFHGA